MTFLWAVVLFGLLIFFHELGHFILAKIVGVKVLKFSLGFGPKLISKKIGDTEYLLSAIPLGGYVKPLGEEIGEEISEEDRIHPAGAFTDLKYFCGNHGFADECVFSV